MFKFLKKMFNKDSDNISKDIVTQIVPACKDCEYCYKFRGTCDCWCNIPLGTFKEEFDPINGIILMVPQLLRNRCEWERTHEQDDFPTKRKCGGQKRQKF